MWEDMLDIEVGNSGGSGCFVAGDEDGGLQAIMVRDSEDAIKAVGKWELDDEVHGDGFKGEGSAVSGDRVVRNVGARRVNLSGLAGGATADKGGDKVLHMGPPVVFHKEKTSFQDARVAHGGGVVI
jgi:hypothetical protein